MAKLLNILYVAAEVYPYTKETEMADIAGGLPLAIKECGHDIRLIMPRYGNTSDKKFKIHPINRTMQINVNLPNGKIEPFTIRSSSIANTKTKQQVYVICNQRYFESRKGVYSDPIKSVEYIDNLERFVYFSRAIVEACVILGWFPDIIHCNDWNTALVPAYIRHFYPQKFKKTKSILTIHNISNQGIFPIDMFDLLGLPEDVKNTFVHKKKLNILKGGMEYANQITTTSQTHKDYIAKNKSITNGLNEIIQANYDKIAVINNKVDANNWNPQKDTLIKQKLTNNADEFKRINKLALYNNAIKDFKLKYNEGTPLIGFIAKLDENNGIDVLIEAIPKIIENNLQLVIFGNGNKIIKEELSALRTKYSKKMALIISNNDEIAHKIIAGTDMSLIISKQEASGINFLTSLTYGSIPIANISGAIKDNAAPIIKKEITENSNCFGLKALSVNGIADAVKDAIDLYSNKEIWQSLVSNVIKKDYTWQNNSVELYDLIYRKILRDEV